MMYWRTCSKFGKRCVDRSKSGVMILPTKRQTFPRSFMFDIVNPSMPQ